ncbi:hypothetical protein C8R43DRAFT_1019508 [Mycena crocata]|nr:hypothetical protein C8R43DRAFT_1019508 [Mycena crocata]
MRDTTAPVPKQPTGEAHSGGADDIQDHEAFVAKHMPDPGCKVIDFRVHTLRLYNWKKLEKSVKSPGFECGGHKWRILLFPLGNTPQIVKKSERVVSVYVERQVDKKGPKNCRPFVQFAIVISNIYDPTVFTQNDAKHLFPCPRKQENDWGFTHFARLNTLFCTQVGDRRPTIEKGAADGTVYLRVLEDSSSTLRMI